LGIEDNPPIPVYDCSGPYTDPAASPSTCWQGPARGAQPAWIEERGDTERLTGPTSAYGRARAADPETAGQPAL
jgi:phosphomethylpyrimidine synthase